MRGSLVGWMPFRRLLVDGEQRWRGTPAVGDVGLLQEAGRGSFGWMPVTAAGARGPSDGGARGPSDGGAENPSGGGSGILRAVARDPLGGGEKDPGRRLCGYSGHFSLHRTCTEYYSAISCRIV
jgi:hypothetical protein